MHAIDLTQETLTQPLAEGENAVLRPEPPSPQPKGESIEHIMLGDSVTLNFGAGEPVSARTTELHLADDLAPTYGQIMALGGDFFGDHRKPISDGETPEERVARFESGFKTLLCKHPERRQTYQARLVLDVMADEARAVNAALAAGKQPSTAYADLKLTGRYRDATKLRSGRVFLSRYDMLSVYNWDHFGHDAVLAYQAGHAAALHQALAARAIKDDPPARRRALELAYARSAFADHFLSDLCSTGHLRTPRKELWKVSGVVIGSLLAWWMHDEESRWGLALENKNGQTWKGHGDKRLTDTYHIKGWNIATGVVQASADEVFQAFHTGKVPLPGDYRALARIADLAVAQRRDDRRHHAPMFVVNGKKLLRRKNLGDLNDYSWTEAWSGAATLVELWRSYEPKPPHSHVVAPTGRPSIDPDGWQSRTPVPPRWKQGQRLRYAVSFVRGLDESELGPWTDRVTLADRFFPTLKGIPLDATGRATSRRVFRQFNDGPFELVGEIFDNTTTTLIDRAELRSEADAAEAAEAAEADAARRRGAAACDRVTRQSGDVPGLLRARGEA